MKVLFLPKKDIPISICNHRFGADLSVCTCTDTYKISAATKASFLTEIFAFKFNITPTYFINNPNDSDFNDLYDSPRCQFGSYFPTTRWYYNGAVRNIPDYDSNVWTEAGAAVFPVTAGDSKPESYPNHGQELYDLTNGQYGYDYVNHVEGSSNLSEIKGLAESVKNSFLSRFGNISSFSYSFGKTGCRIAMPDYFILGRNSDFSMPYDDGDTSYGKNNGSYLGLPQKDFARLDYISNPSTTRFNEDGKNYEYIKQQIAKTILNHGWYKDFIHYHIYKTDAEITYLYNFFKTLDEETANVFAFRCGFNEAAEYLFLREAVKGISAKVENDKIVCFLYINDSLQGLSGMIHQGISFEVDLSNTFLSGKNIKTNAGNIISKGNNVYVIDVVLNNIEEGVISIEIKEEPDTPNYLDFSLPQATYSVSGNTLTVTADKPVQAVLFYKNSSGMYDYATTPIRQKEFSMTHVFDITGLTGVQVGVVTKERQSILIDIE